MTTGEKFEKVAQLLFKGVLTVEEFESECLELATEQYEQSKSEK